MSSRNIVEDLRIMAVVINKAQEEQGTVTMLSGSLFDDAADEIERLRDAGDRLAEGTRTGRWDEALEAWDTARGN